MKANRQTVMKIHTNTLKKLQALKLIDRESYESVVLRLIKKVDKNGNKNKEF